MKKELTDDCPKCKSQDTKPCLENEYVDNQFMIERFKCEKCGCIFSVTFKVDEVNIIE